MDGYFLLTYGDGTIQASDLNATTITRLTRRRRNQSQAA
jgi:hypothetical protein